MDEKIKFGKDKAGYSYRIVTQKYGDLYLDGVMILSNFPFALLMHEKLKLRMQGYITKRIKIKYHQQ